MPLWPIRVLTVSVVAITDIGVYLYDNYIADRPQPIGITTYLEPALLMMIVYVIVSLQVMQLILVVLSQDYLLA